VESYAGFTQGNVGDVTLQNCSYKQNVPVECLHLIATHSAVWLRPGSGSSPSFHSLTIDGFDCNLSYVATDQNYINDLFLFDGTGPGPVTARNINVTINGSRKPYHGAAAPFDRIFVIGGTNIDYSLMA